MWGDLAQVMAQGLRGKRIGEERQYGRDQDLLATVDTQNQRAREQERYTDQKARQAEQDQRGVRRDALSEEMTRLQIADAQARANQQGQYAPQPVQTPWERSGFGDADSFYQHERRLAGSRRAPERPAAPKTRTLNQVQDSAGDYVARFAATEDPTERARLAYQAFLQTDGRPQAGENPDHVWTAFQAASNRMAGLTRPPSADEMLLGGKAWLRRELGQNGETGGLPSATPINATPPAGGSEAQLDGTVVSTLQRELRGARLSGPAAVQFLREEGFNETEVRQILGTGAGGGGASGVRPGTSRADRWEELVAQGMSPDEATARVLREPLDP